MAMRAGSVLLMMGCATSVRTPIADVPSNHHRVEITGYTTTAYHPCEGTATFGEQPRADAIQLQCDGQLTSLPKSEVASLDLAKPSRSGHVALAVVGAVVGLVLLSVLVVYSVAAGR